MKPNAEAQEITWAHWTEKMGKLVDALRLDRKFADEGRPYVELDDSGNVVRRDPKG